MSYFFKRFNAATVGVLICDSMIDSIQDVLFHWANSSLKEILWEVRLTVVERTFPLDEIFTSYSQDCIDDN